MADKIARVAFIADVQSYVNGVDKAQGATKGFQDGIGKMAMPATIAFAAVTAAAVDFTKAAADDEKAAAILAGTLKNTTDATDAQIASVEQWITKTSMATAVADDELRPALGKLATATGDVSKAQDLMGTALNIAAQTGKPLEAVTTAISKAYAGNLGALNKLVPGIVNAAGPTADFADVMDLLAKKTAGAAETAANNDPYAKMGIAIQETKEAIGAGLLPILQQFAPALERAATWAQANADIIKDLMLVVGGLAAAILAINGAFKVYETIVSAVKLATTLWTAAQWLLNVALNANPIGLVVLAIAALVGGLILAYNKVGWFHDLVDAAFKGVQAVISTVVDWIVKNVPAAFNAIVDFVKGLPETLMNLGKSIFNALTWPYREAFHWIAVAWNATVGKLHFEIPAWIPGIGGRSFSMPSLPENIPGLAEGGIVTSPTLALIGEAGPEAVVPLDRMNGVTINVHGALDPVGVARQIQLLLGQANIRLGTA